MFGSGGQWLQPLGAAKFDVEFVFPTSNEMGHPSAQIGRRRFSLDMAALRLAMAPILFDPFLAQR